MRNDTERFIILEVLRTPVKAINIDTGEEFIFKSEADAARTLGLYQSNISKVLTGSYKKTGRYVFEYLEKGDRYHDRNY